MDLNTIDGSVESGEPEKKSLRNSEDILLKRKEENVKGTTTEFIIRLTGLLKVVVRKNPLHNNVSKRLSEKTWEPLSNAPTELLKIRRLKRLAGRPKISRAGEQRGRLELFSSVASGEIFRRNWIWTLNLKTYKFLNGTNLRRAITSAGIAWRIKILLVWPQKMGTTIGDMYVIILILLSRPVTLI